MDWEKYNKIPVEFKTAREIGLAAATLGAMARRGLVEVKDTSPKQYRKVDSPFLKISEICEKHKDDYETYFTLKKKDNDLGMLCSMSSNMIIDCWGNQYDLTNLEYIEFRTKKVIL